MQTLFVIALVYLAIGVPLGWIVRNVGPIGARVDAGTYLTSVLLWPLHLAGWIHALRLTGGVSPQKRNYAVFVRALHRYGVDPRPFSYAFWRDIFPAVLAHAARSRSQQVDVAATLVAHIAAAAVDPEYDAKKGIFSGPTPLAADTDLCARIVAAMDRHGIAHRAGAASPA